jgi:hypothetical protein
MSKYANLSRAEKIMLAIYEISAGKKSNLKYEDIVVSVFKKFPEDFHLRGYKEYPDTGDLVHKPLYDFRKKGFLEANNKIFSLTDRGLAHAEQLAAAIKGKDVTSSGRLSRFAGKEISRIVSSEAFTLFLNGGKDKITDTDFYNYLAVTPRTARNDFLGRLETVESAVGELKEQKKSIMPEKVVPDYHFYMINKFNSIVQHFKKI